MAFLNFPIVYKYFVACTRLRLRKRTFLRPKVYYDNDKKFTNYETAIAISRARQKGLRAAHFGDTVLLVPKKIAKNHQLANYSRG